MGGSHPKRKEQGCHFDSFPFPTFEGIPPDPRTMAFSSVSWDRLLDAPRLLVVLLVVEGQMLQRHRGAVHVLGVLGEGVGHQVQLVAWETKVPRIRGARRVDLDRAKSNSERAGGPSGKKYGGNSCDRYAHT